MLVWDILHCVKFADLQRSSRGDLMLAEFRCITNCINFDSSIGALKMFSIGNAIHECSFYQIFLLLLAVNLSHRKMV